MSDNTLTQITHYQKKLEKYAATGDDEKLLYCIHKLKYLPVTVNHLEITGVGKSINGLRHKNGMIGEKAKALVQKWKLMVAQEEEEQQEANEELESNLPEAYNSKSQTIHLADNNRVENEEEYDPSDEGDRLQIQEDNGEENYNPGGLSQVGNEEDLCNGYDPRTSREDYLSYNTDVSQEYTPTNKYSAGGQDMEEESCEYSPLVPNGFDTDNKEKSHKSKDESKHKKKKHKSRHDKEDKHKVKDETSDSKKSKHKSSKKEKNSKSSKSSSSHSPSKSHSSSHKSDKIKTVDIKSASSVSHNSHSNNNSTSINNSSSSKISSDSSDKKRSRELEDEVESPSRKKSKVSDDHKEKKSHKSKSLKEDHKLRKKQKELETSCEFEAALMGMEGTSSKKKKKKVKEKDTSKHTDETYSPSSPKQNSKFKEFNLESRDHLPNLPSSFEDDIEAPQLMTHYKPLPQVPQRPAARDPFTNNMTDEEALNFMLTSKNSKQRRIYAGKATALSSVPSLFDSCIRVLQENIDALETMGGIPFDILKPVIEKATPQQLFSLEDYNPYLLEDTDVLWAAHCRKSFKNKQREDMETWRDMFVRCTDEHQEKMRTVTESLQKKYITKAPPKRTTQLAFINTVVKPPKSVARAQARYGTASASAVPTRPIKAEEQLNKASSSNNSSNSSSGGSNIVPKIERPMPNKPPAAKKPKVAPLMGKARQLMKKVCRR